MRAPAGCAYLLAVMATLLGGCAHERAELPVLADQVRVEVTDVTYDHSSGAYYLVLQEKSGRRVLPITIGDDEARAIMFELHGIKPERPLTYELLLKTIEQTGNQVDRVLVGDVRDEIYYAKVYLDHGRYELDSRPSDAIALAIGANAPIYVSDRLFQAASPESPQIIPNIAEGWGITVQELTPELARYFGLRPDSGVLVADLGASMETSGLKRGDIVTQVDGRPIESPADFARAAASATGDSKVALTLTRDNREQVVTLERNGAVGKQ